jgi:hypothetical protein
MIMLIGPSCDGAPLELGMLGLDSDDAVIIHAMPAEYGSGLGGSVPPIRLTTVADVKNQDHESAVVNLV